MKYLYTTSIIIALLLSTLAFILGKDNGILLIISLLVCPVSLYLDWYDNQKYKKEESKTHTFYEMD